MLKCRFAYDADFFKASSDGTDSSSFCLTAVSAGCCCSVWNLLSQRRDTHTQTWRTHVRLRSGESRSLGCKVLSIATSDDKNRNRTEWDVGGLINRSSKASSVWKPETRSWSSFLKTGFNQLKKESSSWRIVKGAVQHFHLWSTVRRSLA